MGFEPAIHAGRRLGRYTLVRSLGTGGMAELYLARADGIGGFAKLVALKRILPHKAKNERFVRMLLNEARLVASLEHPNIAAVYDICFEDDEYFFSMEYVHGHDLRRILRAAPNHMLRLENVLHIITGVCAGLHHAHEARSPSGQPLEIVHRDVSPSNVLVSYQGAVKLVDFGVAKAATMVSETREGVIKGKHGYMSPEQCLGDKLDRRSDLFAVGILLWEMTVGRRLYKVNGELATLQRIVYVDAPRPSKFIEGCPPELERIITRALGRDLGARYQTAQELQLDLEAFALANRLPVSPVTMTQEMSELFRDRIDAWREAERAGRSLADYLAEASSEDPVSSGSGGDEDDLDALVSAELQNRFASEPSAVTDVLPETMPANSLARAELVAASRATPSQPMVAPLSAGASRATPSQPMVAPTPRGASQRLIAETPAAADEVLGDARPRAESAPIPGEAPVRGSWTIIIVVTLLLLGGAAAVWMLWLQPSTGDSSEAIPVQMIAITGEPDAGSPASVMDVAEPVDDIEVPPIDAAEAEITDGAEVAEIDPPDVDPDPKGSHRKGGRKKPHEPIGVKAPKDAGTPKDQTPKGPCQPPGKVDPFDARPVCTAVAANPPKDVTPPKKITPPPDAATPTGPPPGTIDTAQVKVIVRSHLGEIETCVSRARMDDRDLTGKVQIRVDVSPAGRVTRTSVVSSKGATPALEACMQKAVASWSFPAPAGGVRGAFSYPFVF